MGERSRYAGHSDPRKLPGMGSVGAEKGPERGVAVSHGMPPRRA